MDEIIRLYAGNLTDVEQTLYNNTNGAVVKTVLIYNSNSTEKEVSIKFDNIEFKFKLTTGEVKIIDSPVVSNLIAAKGLGINIHISGIQLGGA